MAASTQPIRAGVIGSPVEHSRSPMIHRAAAEATGVLLEYDAIDVKPGDLAAAIAMVRETNMRGLSVTMPHKEAVIGELDELTEVATLLGAVNHVTNNGGHLVGNNTDGDGFLLGLAHAHGIDVSGMHVAVFGAGGAARAIINACSRGGARKISVIARNVERARFAATVGGRVAAAASSSALQTADLVVNATPVGMAGTPGMGQVPFEVHALADHAVVVDIVYDPVDTPLLRAAAARSLRAVDGLGMLAGQAAAQFSAWTGVEAPLDVMIVAAAGGGVAENSSIS